MNIHGFHCVFCVFQIGSTHAPLPSTCSNARPGGLKGAIGSSEVCLACQVFILEKLLAAFPSNTGQDPAIA